MDLFLLVFILLLGLVVLRKGMISFFKIAYYEEKLKNRNVDIRHVENIGLIDIYKL